MTSGVVVEGDGALVGPEVMATWLEHVWFRHVPATNFLLADSYHVHTAQTTQKLLLEVRLKTVFENHDFEYSEGHYSIIVCHIMTFYHFLDFILFIKIIIT